MSSLETVELPEFKKKKILKYSIWWLKCAVSKKFRFSNVQKNKGKFLLHPDTTERPFIVHSWFTTSVARYSKKRKKKSKIKSLTEIV